MERQDSNLASRLISRDKDVIAELYDQYSPALYGVIMKITGSKFLAEDVLQETFIKIWTKGHTYDSAKGSLFTWMLNIARNTSIDKLRSGHYRRNEATQVIDLDLHDQRDLSTERATDHIGVRGKVDTLEEKYRIIIDLVYFQGFTQEEIHQHLGIPLGTVKSRMRIAIRQLRGIFKDHGATIITILLLLTVTVQAIS